MTCETRAIDPTTHTARFGTARVHWAIAVAASLFAGIPDAARAMSATNTLTAIVGVAAPAVASIGSPGVQTLGPLIDGTGNQAVASSSITDLPGPTVSGTASATAAPANPNGGTSFAEATVNVRLSYGITLTGPSAISAPILLQGLNHATASGGVTATTSLSYTGGTLVPVGGSTAVPQPGGAGVEWILDPSCVDACSSADSFTFGSTIGLGDFSLVLEGILDVVADEPGESKSGTIFLDPYVYLDPAWAAAHPDYSLVIEPGVGNVPEPSTGLLLLAGVAAIATGRRVSRRDAS